MNKFAIYAVVLALTSLSSAFASGATYKCHAYSYQEKTQRFVQEVAYIRADEHIGAYSSENIYKDYVHPEAAYTLGKIHADLRIASHDGEGLNGGAVLVVFDTKNRFVTSSTVLTEPSAEGFSIRVQYFDEGIFKTLNVGCGKTPASTPGQ